LIPIEKVLQDYRVLGKRLQDLLWTSRRTWSFGGGAEILSVKLQKLNTGNRSAQLYKKKGTPALSWGGDLGVTKCRGF